MNILITGGQFGNKGAQSMLFTVINEIRNRYPDSEFYYLPIDYYKENCFDHISDYRFRFVIDDKAGRDFPARFGPVNHILRWINIQRILRRAKKRGQVLTLSRIWDRMDVMLDISGYSLTSRFGISSINRVLRMINNSKSRGMKTILFPQSYGPFDFPREILQKIGGALSDVDLLFAREEDGIRQLEQRCGVTKAVLSPDIVLQAEEISWKNIYVRKPRLRYPILETEHNVGIIPNVETLRNGTHDYVIYTYRGILEKLRENGKEVYIFRHSNDLSLCREIYGLVKDDRHCHLIEDEIDCISYGPFIRQFDFIVASRFHAVVHAYREGIPAIVLGWAVKYRDLAALLGQELYVFDLTSRGQQDSELLKKRLDRMLSSYTEESTVILHKLRTVRQNNCFDQCAGIFDSIS